MSTLIKSHLDFHHRPTSHSVFSFFFVFFSVGSFIEIFVDFLLCSILLLEAEKSFLRSLGVFVTVLLSRFQFPKLQGLPERRLVCSAFRDIYG